MVFTFAFQLKLTVKYAVDWKSFGFFCLRHIHLCSAHIASVCQISIVNGQVLEKECVCVCVYVSTFVHKLCVCVSVYVCVCVYQSWKG